MKRILIFLYGAIAYGIFFGTFLYAIGFVGNLLVPKGIDTVVDGAAEASLWTALFINVGILGLFAVQHTIMARARFKAWWTRIIPPAMERSTFVLLASLILCLLYWQWRPLTGIIWDVEPTWARALLWGGFALGWGLVLYSTFLIDHFDLFGLRQVWLFLRKKQYRHHPFVERSLYKVIRHPLMLGFIIGFWSTPTMTEGHLLFAAVTTGYILFGVMVEERELIGQHGEAYADYRRRTPMLIPGMKRRLAAASTSHTPQAPSAT